MIFVKKIATIQFVSLLKPAGMIGIFLLVAACIHEERQIVYSLEVRRPSDEVIITLERTGCLGTCPSYIITIYGDGRVVYDGRYSVEVLGEVKTSVPRAKVAELLYEFGKLNYFSLEDRYSYPITDGPSYVTSLKLGDQFKTINHYVCGPKDLSALEYLIDEIVQSEQWIGYKIYDDEHAVYVTCEEFHAAVTSPLASPLQ